MNLISFFKKEFSVLNKTEVFLLGFIFSLIYINAKIVNDNIIAVISATCGILYSFFAGKGVIICYYFGLMGSGCYSYLSFSNALWGNLLLYLLYYIPMEIIGIFSWRKNLKVNSNQIKRTFLSSKQRMILFFIAFLGCFLTILILDYFNDKNPIIDGITTFLSIIGMYLTVKRCIEQWFVWIVVNFLSLIMWLQPLFEGEKVYSIVLMWFFYLIIAIYFLIDWSKEINCDNKKNI